jgi:hypothetical protein
MNVKDPQVVDDPVLPETEEPPQEVTEVEDPRSILVHLGKRAVPEERAALLRVGTDLIDELRY